MSSSPAHSRRALFRFDASAAIGGGHAARCSALATALTAAGWHCFFAITRETRAAVPSLDAAGPRVIEIDPAAACDAAALVKSAPGPFDLLVIDHYGWSAEQEARCHTWAERLLVIDDLCERAHDCDLLLDVSPGRSAQDYRPLLPERCRSLLGPGYAPLRPAFARRRLASALRDRERPLSRILVSLGMLDSANLSETALEALARARFDGRVDLVLGAAAPHLAVVRRRAESSACDVRLHSQPDDLVGLMAEADLVIGAGGGSAWERCCLGLPSLLLVAADNQRHNAAQLRALGAAEVVEAGGGNLAARLAAAIMAVREEPERLRRLATAASSLCDGLGARRVAGAIDPPQARDGRPVTLRQARADDRATLLAWQRHPDTRRFARNPAIPSPAEHEAWLARKLADPGCVFNVIEQGDEPAGTLRFDRREAGASPLRFEVSINVAPDRTGRGIATAALALGRALLPEAQLEATVLPENEASGALFERAGYLADGGRYVSAPLERNDGNAER